MSSRRMSLLPRATLHSDSEQVKLKKEILVGWRVLGRGKYKL
jgi:hypothetical protein